MNLFGFNNFFFNQVFLIIKLYNKKIETNKKFKEIYGKKISRRAVKNHNLVNIKKII